MDADKECFVLKKIKLKINVKHVFNCYVKYTSLNIY
jgi:hypothetical protein